MKAGVSYWLALTALPVLFHTTQRAFADAFLDSGAMTISSTANTATLLPDGKVLVTGGASGNTLLLRSEIYDPATGLWTEIGRPLRGRIGHTATALRNGKVLVAGGSRLVDYRNTAELYDPKSGTWTNTGSMNSARARHTAVLLPDGRVLVTGGLNGSSERLSSAELYDPDTGNWSATGSLNSPRAYHTATLLPNGKVLVAGGSQLSLNTAELFDPATGAWSATAPLLTPRYAHTATLLAEGTVLVVGGYGGQYPQEGYLADAETYDFHTDTWAMAGAMAYARVQHTATLLPNGSVLVTGGWDGRPSGSWSPGSAELYNPATRSWKLDLRMRYERKEHTATLQANGQVLLAGGCEWCGARSELYDSATGTWRATDSFSGARVGHTMTVLASGDLFVVGGTNETGCLASTLLYKAGQGTWVEKEPLHAARSFHTATLLTTGKVLIAGGTGNNGRVSSTELYDPATEAWMEVGALADARSSHTATSLANGSVLVAGGRSSDDRSLSSAELYDPVSGSWSITGEMQFARDHHTATLLPDRRVLVTGGDGTNGPISSAEIYDLATGAWSPPIPMSKPRKNHSATLMPDGSVLLAGGRGEEVLGDAVLFNPAGGSWISTGPLLTPREHHTATLLPNGKLLVAGGWNTNAPIATSELYDPLHETWTGVGTWTSNATLAVARAFHTAALLPDGGMVVAGGYDGGFLSSTEVFDVGLGAEPSWRPKVDSAPAEIRPGDNLTLTGSGFRGFSGGSSGNSGDSPTDRPIVQLRSLENAQTACLMPLVWSTNTFSSSSSTSLQPGYALLTVFVNGIPSVGKVLRIAKPTPAPTFLVAAVATNHACRLSFTNNPGALFAVLASTKLNEPITNWTSLGAATEISPGRFELIDPASPMEPRFYRLRSF